MDRTVARRPGVALLMLVAALLVGACSSADRARRARDAGDPLAAIPLYDEAIARHPGAAGLRSELTATRLEAGHALMRQAREARDAERWLEAVRLATLALRYDRSYEADVDRLRHQAAEALLADVDAFRQAGSFDAARQQVELAAAVLPDADAAATLRAQVDHAEASDLGARTERALEAGDSGAAARFIERATHLAPHRADLTSLAARVDIERRLDLIRTDLGAHRLVAAADALAALDAHPTHAAAIEALRVAAQAERDRLGVALDAARAARDAGRVDEALRRYDDAVAIAVDWPALREERAQVVAAADLAGRRASVDRLLAAGDRLGALRTLKTVLERSGDPADETRLVALRREVIDATRAEVDALLAAGDRRGAAARLDAVLAVVSDPELDARRRRLRRP